MSHTCHAYAYASASRRPRHADTDRELIARILEGDHSANEEFVTRFRRRIYATLRNVGVPLDEREDLCQTVFVHLWCENCRRLRNWEVRGTFGAFLNTVVIRIALERLRQRRPAVSLSTFLGKDDLAMDWEPAASGPCLTSLVLTRQRVSALKDAMQYLSARDAELILRRHFRGENYQDMAAALGLTVNHVGVALHRAEVRLRRQLERSEPGLFDPSPEGRPVVVRGGRHG